MIVGLGIDSVEIIIPTIKINIEIVGAKIDIIISLKPVSNLSLPKGIPPEFFIIHAER